MSAFHPIIITLAPRIQLTDIVHDKNWLLVVA